jgi:hypothetical protein
MNLQVQQKGGNFLRNLHINRDTGPWILLRFRSFCWRMGVYRPGVAIISGSLFSTSLTEGCSQWVNVRGPTHRHQTEETPAARQNNTVTEGGETCTSCILDSITHRGKTAAWRTERRSVPIEWPSGTVWGLTHRLTISPNSSKRFIFFFSKSTDQYNEPIILQQIYTTWNLKDFSRNVPNIVTNLHWIIPHKNNEIKDEIDVLWDFAPCSLVENERRCGGI